MFHDYENGNSKDMALQVIDEYLDAEKGEVVIAGDLANEIDTYMMSDGAVFTYKEDAEKFVNENKAEAQAAYDWAKNMGIDINPIKDVEQVANIMVEKAVNDIIENSEFVKSKDVIELTQTNIDKIRNDVGIEYDAGLDYQYIGNDSVKFVHEWQDDLEQNGVNAFAEVSEHAPIFDDQDEVIGQDICLRETPRIWLDTVEEKFCIYQAGELAMFDADPVTCAELCDAAKDEFADVQREDGERSSLETAKEGLSHYFDEGVLVTPQLEIDQVLNEADKDADKQNSDAVEREEKGEER